MGLESEFYNLGKYDFLPYLRQNSNFLLDNLVSGPSNIYNVFAHSVNTVTNTLGYFNDGIAVLMIG